MVLFSGNGTLTSSYPHPNSGSSSLTRSSWSFALLTHLTGGQFSFSRHRPLSLIHVCQPHLIALTSIQTTTVSKAVPRKVTITLINVNVEMSHPSPLARSSHLSALSEQMCGSKTGVKMGYFEGLGIQMDDYSVSYRACA